MAKRGVTLMCQDVKQNFLAALEQGLSVKDAARSVGYNWPTSLYLERRKDQEFAEAWEEAAAVKQLVVREQAEDELIRRGIEGFDEETWTRGPDGRMRVQKRVRQKDTRALVAVLGANWPEKYGRRAAADDRPQIVVEVDRFAIELQPLAARLLGVEQSQKALPAPDRGGTGPGTD